jgi:hypothetical protein
MTAERDDSRLPGLEGSFWSVADQAADRATLGRYSTASVLLTIVLAMYGDSK